VRFAKPFWDKSKRWINFVSRDRSNRYPVAISMGEEGKHVLCFFVSGDASKELSELPDSTIRADLTKFLRNFSSGEEVVIEEMLVTRWHKDPHSLGSYSYIPIGASVEDLNTMRKPIAERLWFVGEYCHPEMNGCAHAAYETGIWAAEEVIEAIAMKN
jgi:polyamine oxidase